jgi:hypothetical protein
VSTNSLYRGLGSLLEASTCGQSSSFPPSVVCPTEQRRKGKGAFTVEKPGRHPFPQKTGSGQKCPQHGCQGACMVWERGHFITLPLQSSPPTHDPILPQENVRPDPQPRDTPRKPYQSGGNGTLLNPEEHRRRLTAQAPVLKGKSRACLSSCSLGPLHGLHICSSQGFWGDGAGTGMQEGFPRVA